jgi:DNA modification methylase
MDTIRFKNDTKTRNRFFHADSMQHPAKLHTGLLLEILNRYCPEPCVILDPMGGVGTLMLAAQYGHTVILNELETHFLETIPKSWAKIQQNGPALGHTMGQVLILRGDARHLGIASADAVVTSAPYEGAETRDRHSVQEGAISDVMKRSYLQSKHNAPSKRQCKHEGCQGPSAMNTQLCRTHIALYATRAHDVAYTRPVDAVVTSAPYEHAVGEHDAGPSAHAQAKGTDIRAGYARDKRDGENIGNQKGDAYWKSMLLVYQECHRVLRPGGVMALILAGFTRNGLYVDLPSDTMEMCKSLGFEVYDHWLREKWSLSFWRILQKKKGNFDERLNFEHVWVFKKPLHGPG